MFVYSAVKKIEKDNKSLDTLHEEIKAMKPYLYATNTTSENNNLYENSLNKNNIEKSESLQKKVDLIKKQLETIKKIKS